ncbi:MAG: hypothetical protein JSR55_14835 [Proteobacteria bacterium]|nr:hypothetical protein [Pseudomonadota bacterium]
MTSEIAVMNQRAIALAADSAVTLIGGGTVAVRNDHRKLFNLINHRPIGMMFFGVADMMGHPWEHLIEHYQKKVRPKPFARVRDYAVSFTAMMDNLEEFFPRAKQRDEYRRLLASVFRYIFHLAQFMSDNADGERQSDVAILEAAIERVWRDYQFREDGSPRTDLSCFPPNFGAAVQREYAQQIEEIVAYGFGQFQLSPGAMQRLREIAIYAVVKDLFLEDVTGLVFAGFGEDERYPNLVTVFASAMVGGYLKRAEASSDAIDTDTKSKIRVFADSEVTNAFIRGIDLNLERRLYGGVRMMMGGLVDQVVAAFPQADAAQRDDVRARFQKSFVPRYVEAFRAMIADYQQQTFINPILRVLEIASRTELAETAKELVSLNVFKKKIMAQKETVGGAIDVAAISRENGFQWVSKQGGG